MKERFWKELKSELCPRQKWTKDEQGKKCLCCSKQFRILIRRKHHCRFCGKIFCADCSNFFINGNYIGLPQEKYVRHCQFCHHKIQKFIRDCSKLPEQDLQIKESSDGKSDEEWDSDVQQDNFQLQRIFDECQKSSQTELQAKLDDELKNILKTASQYYLNISNIDGKFWVGKLSQLALKGAIETRVDALTEGSQQNAMDIAKIVRFKTIVPPEGQVTSVFMKGLVLQKNLPTKSMINHLSQPRIIVVEKSIDTDSIASFIKFQELVKNQKLIMRKILQKIAKLNPDIIFVQNSVSMFALDYFQQRKIVVISKLKPRELQAIKYVAKIKKSIRKLWMIDKYKPHNILGQCDKIYFKSVREGQSLMFMQGEVGMRSIILGESTEQVTDLLKKSLQNLLRLARRMHLEKYIIMMDMRMNNLLPKSKPKFACITSFAPDIETMHARQQVVFTYIVYSKMKIPDAPKNYQEYASKIGKRMNHSLREICGKVEFERKKIYSSSDCTLGSVILLTAANAEKTCKKCELTHSESFYFNGVRIRVQVKKKDSTAKSSFSEDIQESQKFTIENLKFFLKKQKQMLVIQSYLVCSTCHSKLTGESFKVGKNYLQNSFTNFLQNLAQFYILGNIEQQQNKVSQRQRKVSFRKMNSQCLHEEAIRVIQYSGTMIEFYVDRLSSWEVDEIKITTEEALAQISTYDQNFIRSLYTHQLADKKDLLQQACSLLSLLPFPASGSIAQLQGSISSRIMMHYQTYTKLKEILDRTRQELVMIRQKSEKALSNLGHDWTLFMRQIYKVESVIKPTLEVIQSLQSVFKKDRDRLTIFQQPSIKENFNDQQSQTMSLGINYSQQTLTNEKQSIRSPRASRTSNTDSNLKQIPQSVIVTEKKQDQKDSQLQDLMRKVSKCRYPRSQGHILYFTPIYTFDPVSVIASGLNSSDFNRYLKEQITIPTQLKLKLVYNRRLKTNWQVRVDIDTIHAEMLNDADKDKMQTVEVTVYYHTEFEELRVREGISWELFVRSMCGCQSWDSSGGKSNSRFAKSHNQLLVVKVINQKEFVQFQRFSPSYLNHIKQSKICKQDSLIARIYGIFDVSMKGKHYNCIVMQNIFFGLGSSSNLKVYDLKGSEVNRLNMPIGDQKNITGQDTNFKIDRNSQPLIISCSDYDRIIRILELDAVFLREQAVIDYSLLVILTGDKRIRMGIIDFMRPYQFTEKIETQYKKLKSRGVPTVVPPDHYAERFIQAMKKYLVKIQSYTT